MTVNDLVITIKTEPEGIDFNDVIATIDSHYKYTATRFSNGVAQDTTINEAGSNEGSCKIFAFGLLNKLDKKQTLACFGRYYREDVLENPENDDHSNIRLFMKYGWQGITFEGMALAAK